MYLSIPRSGVGRPIVVRRIYYHLLWTIIHLVGYLYPDDPLDHQKSDVELFYKRVGSLITCGSCRAHYTSSLRSLPPVMTDRVSIFDWTVTIHNSVNVALKKSIISTEEARKIYDDKHEVYLRQLETEFGINLFQMLNSGNLTRNLTMIRNKINKKLKK